MNVFAIDECPRFAAVWQHDKHVIKMTLEAAQLLSTAVRHNDSFGEGWAALCRLDVLYESISNPGHGSAVWTRENIHNFAWVAEHGHALSCEYTRRFGRRHASMTLIEEALAFSDVVGGDYLAHTPFYQAMPDEYKVPGAPIEAYRRYYLGEKIGMSRWTNVRAEDLPDWLRPVATLHQRGAGSAKKENDDDFLTKSRRGRNSHPINARSEQGSGGAAPLLPDGRAALFRV